MSDCQEDVDIVALERHMKDCETRVLRQCSWQSRVPLLQNVIFKLQTLPEKEFHFALAAMDGLLRSCNQKTQQDQEKNASEEKKRQSFTGNQYAPWLTKHS